MPIFFYLPLIILTGMLTVARDELRTADIKSERRLSAP